MIPVAPQPVPTPPEYDFQRDVYARGEDTLRQLAGLPPLRPRRGRRIQARVARIEDITAEMLRDHPHWTRAMPALHKAYGGMCAYLARYIELVEVPTTDHFVALRNACDPRLAYTWFNFRLACGYMNSCKGAIPEVLDPFAIGDGWFALNLNDFHTVVGPAAPPAQIAAIEATIRALHFNGAEVVELRRRAAARYWRPPPGKAPLPLWYLEEQQPFLAREIRRQGRLRPDDA